MNDEQINELITNANQAVSDAREMVRVLDFHAAELKGALIKFSNHHVLDASLRQREIAVLAREDRCTVRERELEQREKG